MDICNIGSNKDNDLYTISVSSSVTKKFDCLKLKVWRWAVVSTSLLSVCARGSASYEAEEFNSTKAICYFISQPSFHI